MSEHHCWSCSFDWDNPSAGRARRLNSALLYERAVETIEAWTGPFSIQKIWRKIDMGPCYYGPVRNAIYDMATHGLIRCVRRDKPGRRCLAWEAVTHSVPEQVR